MAAAPSYQIRMAMRIMIHARLRVSEYLFLRPMDIWLDRAPSSTCRKAELQGHKAPTAVTINIIGMAKAGALYLPYLGSVCGILTRDLRLERAVRSEWGVRRRSVETRQECHRNCGHWAFLGQR